jgi:hypothetical protein
MQLLSDVLPEIDAEPGPLAPIVFHCEGWRIFRPDHEHPFKVYPGWGWDGVCASALMAQRNSEVASRIARNARARAGKPRVNIFLQNSK